MATIATKNEVITVIIIFSVKPEQQQELIDAIAEFVEIVKQQPGFVSANIHKSIDGLKVANYAQWQNQADYNSFINNTELQAKAAKLREFNPPDIHIYEVVISESKQGIPKIRQGQYITHFAEFRMPLENQPRMIELAKENVGKAMELPSLISANFHRSLDGTRVINYGQWLDRESIENLKKQPGFGKDFEYWEGIAENEHHLYEVVLTVPND
ncbi:antibiotic biosynthesis monooxygenase [Nostocaceae cyanobacterium CENA357]|uniref:Antibiotic biosynthesis monooxygenase n=1 Tax=Atlanticothrix silvestris CENA357 TaxID=1725252 RepID=A0A8J7HFS2_9CYAN|nr:antibiotic biosynthesis monooxygenase family protein [Atlanticothrix silvestris]MBH8554206.1 antibiotic biosynthesis monooxygenase [Atlanticothrix silvestris CENA357]